MRYWLTDKLRPIEGGRATMGKPISPMAQLIPPKQAQFTNYAYCSAQCTESFPKDGINILGGLLHTHLAGRQKKNWANEFREVQGVYTFRTKNPIFAIPEWKAASEYFD